MWISVSILLTFLVCFLYYKYHLISKYSKERDKKLEYYEGKTKVSPTTVKTISPNLIEKDGKYTYYIGGNSVNINPMAFNCGVDWISNLRLEGTNKREFINSVLSFTAGHQRHGSRVLLCSIRANNIKAQQLAKSIGFTKFLTFDNSGGSGNLGLYFLVLNKEV